MAGAVFADVAGWRTRIVLDVTCASRINHECQFFPAGANLVMLEGDFGCSARRTGRFACDEDES